MSDEVVHTELLAKVGRWAVDATTYVDTDSTPWDAECYSGRDVLAWEADEWHYVGLVVRVIQYAEDGTPTTHGESDLWGIEDGTFNGRDIGPFDDGYPLRDVTEDAIRYAVNKLSSDGRLYVMPVDKLRAEAETHIAEYETAGAQARARADSLRATEAAFLHLRFTHPTTGAVEPLNVGCVVDGHWGQYAASRVIRQHDDLFGSDLWTETRDAVAEAIREENPDYTEADIMAEVTGTMTDELAGHEYVSEAADEAEAAMNRQTVGGYWGWHDGEFFLTETFECANCEAVIESDYDSGWVTDIEDPEPCTEGFEHEPKPLG